MAQQSLSLSVLVPVYNERYLVASSLRGLIPLAREARFKRVQVVVVDDGSTDGTLEVLHALKKEFKRGPAAKLEWVFHEHGRNQGKGAAFRTALALADGEVSLIHDADLEYNPDDIPLMMDPFLSGHADAVYGSRFLARRYRRLTRWRHEQINYFLSLMARLLTDLSFTDAYTCYKAARTALLKSIPFSEDDFRFDAEYTVKLAKRGARIFEVPISYSGRSVQEGKKISWKDGPRGLRAYLKHTWADDVFVGPAHLNLFARLDRAAPRYRAWLAEACGPWIGQRVLELGAKTGHHTVTFVPRNAYWATDTSEVYLDSLRVLQPNRPYLKVGYCDAGKAASYPKLPGGFDTVLCLNELAFVSDPAQACKAMAASLAPGGRVVAVVPQGPALFGSLDQAMGHQRRFKRAELRAWLQAAGLELEHEQQINKAGAPLWWLNSRLLGRRSFGLLQLKLGDWASPLLRLADHVLPWNGMSLLAVARKPHPKE